MASHHPSTSLLSCAPAKVRLPACVPALSRLSLACPCPAPQVARAAACGCCRSSLCGASYGLFVVHHMVSLWCNMSIRRSWLTGRGAGSGSECRRARVGGRVWSAGLSASRALSSRCLLVVCTMRARPPVWRGNRQSCLRMRLLAGMPALALACRANHACACACASGGNTASSCRRVLVLSRRLVRVEERAA